MTDWRNNKIKQVIFSLYHQDILKANFLLRISSSCNFRNFFTFKNYSTPYILIGFESSFQFQLTLISKFIMIKTVLPFFALKNQM